MYKLILSIVFVMLSLVADAQILPKEGNALNYRLIGFSFPAKQGYDKYTIEIAESSLINEKVFKARIIQTFSSNKTKLIGEVPSFGMQYTWRVVYSDDKGKRLAGELHHFRTLYEPATDTSLYRIRVIKNNDAYKGSYFFADGNKALYDMKGNPIWFLPEIEKQRTLPRDIKLTPQGTISFLLEGTGAYDVNYNGAILWKAGNNGAVSGEKQEYFNHELTSLANGHYMVLGRENVMWELPGGGVTKYDTTDTRIVHKNHRYYQKLEFGTVIEYDAKGNLVWSWKSSAYFKNSDLSKLKTANGLFDIENVHENSLYFDERTKNIYMGFRNISRILKVSYPDGKVIAEYGKKYTGDTVGVEKNDLYCTQHCCRHEDKGDLYLLNNNDCNFPAPPSILVLKEPAGDGADLIKTWEYKCNILSDPPTSDHRPKGGGGSVYELPDHSFFACVNYLYTGIFVVGRDKNIRWSAVSETYDKSRSTWMPSYQYRTFMITREQLEKLIWGGESK